jgi:FMN phosphatase YigB (HAD superfamily)
MTELRAQLLTAHLSLDMFHPSLRFFSFEHGFSKPDPHVMRVLGARLRMLGVPIAEVLAVGDRVEHDIEPARAQGWQTWHLAAPGTPGGGDWRELGLWLAQNAAT